VFETGLSDVQLRAQVKAKGERRIDFRQFNAAVDLMAEKKGKDRDKVRLPRPTAPPQLPFSLFIV
jgi:hypothetical protein